MNRDRSPKGGGFVMLLGAEVENAGQIATRKGQALLAAGDDFLIRPGMQITGTDAKGVSTGINVHSTVRGNEVAAQFNPGSVTSGKATNRGLIIAREGDITLTGRDVRQDGVAVATTTVNIRGTIHLSNSANDAQGRVALGSSALTAIAIENTSEIASLLGVTAEESRLTALNSQRDALVKESAALDQQRIGAAIAAGLYFDNYATTSDRRDLSRIEIVGGGLVDFEGGSFTLATGGQLAVHAGNSTAGTKDGAAIRPTLGEIRVRPGAQLDVSGSFGVKLAMESNNVLVNIQGNELRDAPINRDLNVLRNASVWVDLRGLIYVPAGTDGYDSDRWYTKGGLLEVGGYLGQRGHGIGEWTAQGGIVTFATDRVNMQAGSLVNLSGGTLDYAGGYIRSTNLVGSDGRRYSIDSAPADLRYANFAGGFRRAHNVEGREDSRLTEIWTTIFDRGRTSLRWEDGYRVGRDAGRFNIQAIDARLDGSIEAAVYNGLKQIEARPVGDVADGYKLGQNQAALPGLLSVQTYDPNAGSFNPRREWLTDIRLDNTLPETEEGADNLVWLNLGRLNEAGLGGIIIKNRDSIVLSGDLTLAPGGMIDWAGGIEQNGSLTARGGSVKLVSSDFISSGGTIIRPGSLTLKAGRTIDTRGLWSNATLDPANAWQAAFRNGGSIRIDVAGGSLVLEAGSFIDASAGAAVSSMTSYRGGAGGDISLSSGTLTLDGTLASNGFTRGGKLTIATREAISIGGKLLDNNGRLGVGETVPFELMLAVPTWFEVGELLPFVSPIRVDFLAPGDNAKGGIALTNWTDRLTIGPDGWLIPNGGSAQYLDPMYGLVTRYGGDYVPPGTRVGALSFPANIDYVLPAGAFPNGVAINPLHVPQPAGTMRATGRILAPVGTVIPSGTMTEKPLEVYRTLDLVDASSFFRQGFSSYDLSSTAGLIVQPGTRIDVVQPVLQFTGAGYRGLGGDALASAAGLYLQPEPFLANPATSALTQRAGADLSLGGGAPYFLPATPNPPTEVNGGLVIGAGARIGVDPGRRIGLKGQGQITVEGTLTAHGGEIAVVNTRGVFRGLASNGYAAVYNGPGAISVWIGSNAVLDVSGVAVTARDRGGRSYGLVLDGGSIVIGGVDKPTQDTINLVTSEAWVIIRQGALLDASGTSAILDFGAPLGGGINGARTEPRRVSSHGGSIALSSYSGVFIEGELRANAGGAGASGGSLSVAMETPVYTDIQAREMPLPLLVGRQLFIGQNLRPSGLAAGIVAGKADAGLVIGTGRIATTQIEDGGFDVVTLFGRNGLVFDGDVSLHAGRSLTLAKGALLNTTAGANVMLAAPYVRLEGWTESVVYSTDVLPSVVPTRPAGGDLTIAGQLVDVRHRTASAYDLTIIESSSDLRLLASIAQTQSGSAERRTMLGASGRLELAAAQVYPASNAIAEIRAGSVLSIESRGDVAPAMPYSVFGNLTLRGQTIRQGGVLRAPLGDMNLYADSVELLPGSITSVSARGLLIPYGGSADGQVYLADGTAVKAADLIGGTELSNQGSINIAAGALISERGSLLDLSGGGAILGGAFVSGRGGSVDTLLYPREAGNKVFAIVPGIVTAPAAGGYTSAWTGAVPQIGQQITIPAGVPGLAAGTYTLLPANYALLPGAFRVELDGTTARDVMPSALARRDGSWAVTATTGIAGTGIADALPRVAAIASGEVFKTWSQYNTQSYAQFQVTQTDRFSLLRPRLEVDGKSLVFAPTAMPGSAPGSALVAAGSVDFSAAEGGYGGSFSLVSGPSANLILTGPGSTAVNDATHVTVSAAAVNALGAPNLYIGGFARTFQNTVMLVGLNRYMGSQLVLERGVKLNAAQVLLAADGTITLGDGVEINTLGRGIQAPDSASGLIFGRNPSPDERSSMIAVSNGQLVLNAPSGVNGSMIEIGDGVSLYSEGGIGLYADLGASLAGTVRFGTRNLMIAVPSFNIGSAESLAAAGSLPAGMVLNQSILNAILAGNPAVGAPAVETLILSATNSVNFFGGINLDTRDPLTGRSRLGQFVVNSPAIYGYGSASDSVRLTTDTFVWNGNSHSELNPADFGQSLLWHSNKPGAVRAGGTGSGQFAIDANVIVLGYPTPSQPNTRLSFDRLMLGFTDVAFNAGSHITANSRGTISVYHAGTDPGTLESFDPAIYAGTGGTLHLNTPVLTGEAGASIAYYAGGPIRVALPSSAALATMAGGLGAQVSLNSNTSIDIASAIVLQSGKLTLSSAGNVTLADGARLDLSGRTVKFYDVTRSTWGGELFLESENGSIIQQAGAVIDLSAQAESAGMLTLSALNGAVRLDGSLKANGGANHASGSFDLRAGSLGGGAAALSDDFAALNAKLSDAGFFAARAFAFRQGNLVIGNGLKARDISVSVDGGSLTVLGHVDASGNAPGSIRLAARDDLIIGGGAVLDAHGQVLQKDSYGQAVEAKNRGTVELTSTQGWLRLQPGATINLVSTDGIARGRVDLNAGRTGETSGDVRIDAAGPLNIAGAGVIALNAFWTYHLPGGVVIDQALIDGYDAANTAFMGAAYSGNVLNTTLQGRVAGLASYGDAFHLRPGVAITSDGDLSTSGDIDLSRYRYGPNRDRDPASATYGRGEPMALTVRAGGDLTIKGSISDGFGPDTPDIPATYTGVSDVASSAYFSFVNGTADGWPADYYAANGNFYLVDDWTIPVNVFYTDWTNSLTTADYARSFYAGDTIPAGTYLIATNLQADASLPRIASGRTQLVPGASSTSPRAPMLAAGSLSASIRLIAGADLIGADPRALKPLRGQAYVPSRTEFGGLIDVTTSPGFRLDSSWGIGPLYLGAGGGTYFFADDWTVPNTTVYQAIADNGLLVDLQWNSYAPGSVVPKGTAFDAWSLGFDGSGPIPSLATRLLNMPARYSGAVLLNDPRYSSSAPVPSVIRTGTGSLDILAASNITLLSDYGIYTAGTDTRLQAGNEAFNQPRKNTSGTVYYPDHGGDLFVAAQGELTGYSFSRSVSRGNVGNSAVGDWLWRQGGGEIGEETAWGINFGAFVGTGIDRRVAGFSGFGALGGGNVTLRAGGDAGNISPVLFENYDADIRSTSLIVAVGATGRIQDGVLTQTGGGDVRVRVGGRLNPALTASLSAVNELTGGVFTNLRGGIDISAGSIGRIDLAYGTKSAGDPRATNLYDAGTIARVGNSSSAYLLLGGPVVVPGDGAVALRSRGDLVFGNSADATMQINDDYSYSGSVVIDSVVQTGTNRSWFSLWTPETAVSLISAGGNLAPFVYNGQGFNRNGGPGISGISNVLLMPARFDAAATSGSIYYGSLQSNQLTVNELMPSATGQFELLAMNSIHAAALQGPARFLMSGASDQPDLIPNPFKPAFVLLRPGVGGDYLTDGFLATNTMVTLGLPQYAGDPGTRTPTTGYFAFQNDMPTHLHAGDPTAMRVYAVNGDIVDLRIGGQINTTTIAAAKAAHILAGRDIVRFGGDSPFDLRNLILNANADDVSILSAGRDIFYANLDIAGPGSLEVTAARNIYQGELGSIVSTGPIVQGDRRLGASILMQAGTGPAGPNYAGLLRYLDPANLADAGNPLADQPGKVARTYEKELADWLKQRYGYSAADAADARTYFDLLKPEQQHIFLREVYFAELREGGREYNNVSSPRYGSYLRGRLAIEALFPQKDADGNAIRYAGDITMFSTRDGNTTKDGSVRTLFGGDIQFLVPHGKITIGVEGVVPGANAGLVTQGEGNISLYSQGSILLGLSRIMTTFGGNILAWSATGDINAGRGAKTTIVYTPPKREYDIYGNVVLSPNVPASGAGIATLNPIPEVPAGDIDLIAPLGTIDAGEAGIRVSGNVNLAALQVLNAANIQVQGTSSGVPTVQAPSITAALSTSNATAASQQTTTPNQGSGNAQPSVIIVEVLGYGGGESDDQRMRHDDEDNRRERRAQNPNSRVQVLAAGELSVGEAQRLADIKRAAGRQR